MRVVHLSPDGAEQTQTSGETASALNGEDPEDTAPRPRIRVSGTAGRGKRGTHTEQVEETMPDEAQTSGTLGPPIQSGAPRPSALDPEAKRAYDAALSLVNQKQYGQALEAFAAFLVKWPDHPNADNATYWRGECYFAQGEYARAAEQFEGVLTRFPLGNKVPDALLKLGMSQDKLGNPQKAAQAYERLTREFPRSEAAHRIPSANGEHESRRSNSGDAPAPRREVKR
jgi:tol-pal system protein YbgF